MARQQALVGAMAAAILVLAATPAPAADEPVVDGLKFLTPADLRPAAVMARPPPPASVQAAYELAELQRLGRERSAADFAKAKHDDETENASIFADAIGPGFDLKKLPATAKVLDDVRSEEKAAAKAAKTWFARNRPWIIDPRLVTCSHEDPPQSSYPSGHSTMGYSMALVLAQLEPAHATAIMARAADYAENRLVCGMHFRSDIVAGQALGTTVAEKLMDNTAFRQEMAAASAELKAAGL
jgi:acid phosphatase (class A)